MYKGRCFDLEIIGSRASLKKKGACCAGSDINDARLVASQLDIPHYVLNYENLFKDKVMEDFADSYLRGETPIPCIRCNQTVKFTDMVERAKQLGASAMATGHYIRRKRFLGYPNLFKGLDETKDQSYFLFATTKSQLEFLRFPLGSLTKEETRMVARRHNLNVAEKPDSQDICFVPEGKYADVVRKLRPGNIECGNIIDVEGKVLGQHNGIIDYTIGQRKGIKIASNNPLYVINIDADSNTIIVGGKECLEVKEIKLRELNILGAKEEFNNIVNIKVRSTGKLLKAKINLLENSANVEILDKETGISPG